MADETQPDEKSQIENVIEAEGDAIDHSSLPPDLGGQPQQEDTVEVQIGGQSFNVPRDLADAYQRQQQVREEPREDWQQTFRQPEPEPAPQEDDWDSVWWSDPKAAKQRIVEEAKEEIRAEYRQERAREQFWGDFYSENPTLNKYRTMVNAVMQEEWAQLQNLPNGRQTRDKLAEMTKNRLLSIAQDFKPRAVEEQDLESGPGPRVVNQERPEQRPHSLTETIRERQRARRDGGSGA